jgi:hypothetical protein
MPALASASAKTDWSPLADGGTGLAAQLLKRRLLDVRHIYYHG